MNVQQRRHTVKLLTKRGSYLPRNQNPPVFPGCWGFAEMGYHAPFEQQVAYANQIKLGIAETLMLPFMQSSRGASPLQNLRASWGGDFVYLYPRSHSTYTTNAGTETWRNPFQVQVTREAPRQTTKQHNICGLKGKTDQWSNQSLHLGAKAINCKT